MKHVWLGLMVACLLCCPVVAQSKGSEYVKGKIVSVHKLGTTTPGGTDAPLASPSDKYEISIQVGDRVYVCRYATPPDQDLSWIQNKEGQVKIKGKTMFVKRATGKDAQASILRTTKAPTP